MKNTTLTESQLSEMIIQSLQDTKDFEIFLSNIISKIKLLDPYIDFRSQDFNIVINTFYKWNIFNIRNSITDVARGFQCSRITVYNRINAITNNGGHYVSSNPNNYTKRQAVEA